MNAETVLVCLAQEMAILLHKPYMGNLSKSNEEQRNRCLIKTEGCIVMFFSLSSSCWIRSKKCEEFFSGRSETISGKLLTAFVLALASSGLLSLIIMFSRHLNQNKSTDCLFARLGVKRYIFLKTRHFPC